MVLQEPLGLCVEFVRQRLRVRDTQAVHVGEPVVPGAPGHGTKGDHALGRFSGKTTGYTYIYVIIFLHFKFLVIIVLLNNSIRRIGRR